MLLSLFMMIQYLLAGLFYAAVIYTIKLMDFLNDLSYIL